jgi:hypothetical protein
MSWSIVNLLEATTIVAEVKIVGVSAVGIATRLVRHCTGPTGEKGATAQGGTTWTPL